MHRKGKLDIYVFRGLDDIFKNDLSNRLTAVSVTLGPIQCCNFDEHKLDLN